MDTDLPPGPRWPAPLQALATSQLPRLMEYCHRRFGDRFTIRMGGFGTFVYLVDPADIRAVFHGDDEVFHAGEANAPFLGRVLGPSSVLCTDDEVHRRQRRHLSGPFHGTSIAKLTPLMAEIAAQDVRRWPIGTEFPVLPHMRRVTLEVILRAVIGVDAGERARLAQLRPWPGSGPGPGTPRCRPRPIGSSGPRSNAAARIHAWPTGPTCWPPWYATATRAP
jgi:cytochrome P450